MRRFAFALFLFFPILSCTQPAPVTVTNVWTRDTVGRTANAAVFMTISSQTPDRLIGASTPVAKKTGLMTMEGGSRAMAMRYLEAIDIPAGKPVSLNPRGLHIWLAGLQEPFRAGQTFPLFLQFENAGQHRVVVSVTAPAATPPLSGMRM